MNLSTKLRRGFMASRSSCKCGVCKMLNTAKARTEYQGLSSSRLNNLWSPYFRNGPNTAYEDILGIVPNVPGRVCRLQEAQPSVTHGWGVRWRAGAFSLSNQ